MELTIYGSGQEVGKSSIVLDGKLMLDSGVKIEPEPSYPRIANVDAAILTHAHLDHSGAGPLLYKHGKPPMFMTDMTFGLAKLLIQDSMKVAQKRGFPTPFTNQEYKRFVHNTKIVHHRERFRASSFSCELFRSGHIPGSSSALVRGQKKLFYTSDIQTTDSHLLRRNSVPKKCDVLIIESTYSHRDRPSREKEEKRLFNHVEEAVANDGIVLLPAFSVGRSQELLLLLEEYADKMIVDGMARKASQIILQHGHQVKNIKHLRSVMNKVAFIRSHKDRDKLTKKRPIIISSAGMLGGGPAVYYLEKIKDDPYSKVVFTGFLVPDSSGRHLLESGIYENEGKKFRVKCDIDRVELSAHADRSGLLSVISDLRPEAVICLHGEKCKEFAADIEEGFNIDAFAPKNEETLRF